MPKVIRNGHNEALIRSIGRTSDTTTFHLTPAGIGTDLFYLAVYNDKHTPLVQPGDSLHWHDNEDSVLWTSQDRRYNGVELTKEIEQ
ncbi:MAG: hypothetical protein U0X20_07960 [Caldilineaceae bacterium]